ncbi:MAG: hypothetical protein AAFO69_00270 [Bacteroidota bacterium]
MKNLILVFGFTFLLTSLCQAQAKHELLNSDFELVIDFYPSFMTSGRVTIRKEGEKKLIKIQHLLDIRSPFFKSKDVESIALRYHHRSDNALLMYDGKNTYLSTLGVFSFTDDDLIAFSSSLGDMQFSQQESLVKEGMLDGIAVYLDYKSAKSSNSFSLRCPFPSDLQFVIIKSIFLLLESVIQKPEVINYIERLKSYFDFGLRIKQVSKKPLEYRFSGSITADEAEEFYKWISNLPKYESIVFDLSNFERMGTMFYSDFQDLIEENGEVFWLVSQYTIRQVKDIGVKKDRFFTSKEALMNAIKALK